MDCLGKSKDALSFWLSFFKPQMSCSADEFFEAIRQLYDMCNLPGHFAGHMKQFEAFMVQANYVISVEEHADHIIKIVEQASKAAACNPLEVGYKTYTGNFPGSSYVDTNQLGSGYTYEQCPSGLVEVERFASCDLQRKVMHVRSNAIPENRLKLKFEAVDTEELKNIEVTVDGDKAIYKVGEGETANYHIPNDKKLWETQFVVCCIDGNYYLRDMGFVHNSRVKLDHKCEVQIQKGSVVDLGKVVHYHFDKVVHAGMPSSKANDNYYILRPDQDYEVDPEDFPTIRARPVWVSADENEDNIQNEIHVVADGNKNSNSLGRSMKRDIQIKLKAVSADHCCIHYQPEKGWTVTERGKDKCSSNGTYIFLKSQQ